MRKRTFLAAVTCLIVAMTCCLFVGCGDDGKMTISIANKTELTAKWVEGDADRTVAVTFTPDTYTTENTAVVVSTDNSDVISTDGFTLKAVGGGTATITVTAGSATDSVQITVAPSLKTVSIMNKADLKKAWVVGEADREIALSFTPDYYTEANAEAEIVSDNPEVVSVSGNTLRAVAEGTATVTVTAFGKTDSVELTISPELESVTVGNKTALEEPWAVGVERAIEPVFAPSSYTAGSVTPEITCEPAGIIEVSDGWKIKAKEVGTATVTVTVRGKSDSFTVTTEHAAPTLAIVGSGITETADGYRMESMQDIQMVVPVVTATTPDGASVEVEVVYGDLSKLHIDGAGMTPEVGTHTVTYKAVNPNDETKITEKTLTIDVYRKIFGSQDGSFTVTNERVAADKQTVTNSNGGYTYARFNMEPSKLYYAEVTFRSTVKDNVWIGLSNMIKGNNDKFAVSATVLSDTNSNSGEFRTTGDNSWNITTVKDGYPLFQSWQLAAYRGLPIDTSGEIKYATVRDGDYMFYFVNDVYVNGYTLKDYRNVDTVPGIFGSKLNNATMSKIDYYSGDKARTKIDALLAGGKNLIGQYLIWTSSLANDANSYGNEKNRFFKVNDVSDERGVNFDFTNYSVDGSVKSYVTPYIHFDGDFSFEFDYKATQINNNNNFNDDGKQHRMYVRVRNWLNYQPKDGNGNEIAPYRKDILWFGAQAGNNGGVLCKDKAYRADTSDWTRLFYDTDKNFDATAGKGLRFKITRRLYEDHAEYTLTVTALDDTSKTATKILNVTASEDSQWDKPVQIYWENQLIAGQYSNIKWNVENFQSETAE